MTKKKTSEQETMIYQIKRLFTLQDVVSNKKNELFEHMDNLTSDQVVQLKLLVAIEQEVAQKMLKGCE